MVGGVDLGWVFTSAGESGIVPTVCTLLPVEREKGRGGGTTKHRQSSTWSTCIGEKKLTFKVETAG